MLQEWYVAISQEADTQGTQISAAVVSRVMSQAAEVLRGKELPVVVSLLAAWLRLVKHSDLETVDHWYNQVAAVADTEGLHVGADETRRTLKVAREVARRHSAPSVIDLFAAWLAFA